MSEKLKINAARCLKCNRVIVSRHVHDFVWCLCRNIFVDGGLDYQRIGGYALDDDSYELINDPELVPKEG